MARAHHLPGLILILASLLGLWAFLSPFFTPETRGEMTINNAHLNDAPLIFALLFGLCLLVIVASLETRELNSQFVAVLGVLVAINATLRLIPGLAGFSAVFFLPILCGYVFGADFGFLLGALSLLLSAFITSGVGPWLPFQMFAAGWSGMVSGWLPRFKHHPRLELGLLIGWGSASGFLFGAVMNLWFWPFMIASPDGLDAWTPGIGLLETLTHYGIFYVATSLWWDAARALGNMLLLLLVGVPILRLLRRFHARFHFSDCSDTAADCQS